MSSEVAITVENLSKCYQIYSKPHDRLKQAIYPRLQRLTGSPGKQYFSEFWALKNISFEIKRGETVGIIGRNGSGKSTLLQLICGTLGQSGGFVQTYGRVAALLELGSGFNPEFTGRENVYMNAAILGLSKEETDTRYGDVVAFADIGEFIDQPVKTYSSGMMVRLAFAVIAHVDADILVIDEALAVGDAVFTQKCMRFLRRFMKQGTVLFVSHDVASVQSLCQRAIWLDNGEISLLSDAKTVAEAYLQYTFQKISGEEIKLRSISKAADDEVTDLQPPLLDYEAQASVIDNRLAAGGWSTGEAEVVSVQLALADGTTESLLRGGERVSMTITARAITELDRPILGFIVRDRLGQDLFGENTLPFTDSSPLSIPAGQVFHGVFVFRLPMLPNGQYAVMASVANGTLQSHVQHHWLHDALIINVFSSKVRWGLVGVPFEKVELQCHSH